MSYGVAGVYHLYFGDASKHPIIGNYRRSLPELPQRIVLSKVSGSRFARLWTLVRDLVKVRRDADWALQCHDVLSAVMGVLIWNGRVIYDSHEIYQSFPSSRLLSNMVAMLERFSIRRSDITIFPSGYRRDYYDVTGQDVRIIENLYYPYDKLSHERHRVENNAGPVFVYTGLFTDRRAVDTIVAAFRDERMSHARLILAGRKTEYLNALLPGLPSNAEYIGELSHQEVSELLSIADAGFAIYRPVNENNRRCAPTKVFELLYFGLTVIVNESPYMSEIQERVGDHLIRTVREISSDAIADSCSQLGNEFKAQDESVSAAVCWQSQIQQVRSLYL